MLEAIQFSTESVERTIVETSKPLNLLPQLLLVQSNFENFAVSYSQSVYFYDTNKSYL